MFILKLCLRPWRFAFFTQVLSAITVGLLFFIGALFWAFESGMEPVLARVQSEQLYTVYLDSTQSAEQELKTVDQIRLTLGSAPIQIESTTPAQFLEKLREQYPDLASEIVQLGQEGQSVVPRFLTLIGANIDHQLSDLKAVSGVESVESSRSHFVPVAQALRSLQKGSEILLVGTAFALLSLLFVLAKVNEQHFSGSLKVLRFWGAPSWMLSIPSIGSSLMVGLFGGALAYGAWRILGPGAFQEIQVFSPLLSEIQVSWIGIANQIVLLALGFSVLSGWMGSGSSARR